MQAPAILQTGTTAGPPAGAAGRARPVVVVPGVPSCCAGQRVRFASFGPQGGCRCSIMGHTSSPSHRLRHPVQLQLQLLPRMLPRLMLPPSCYPRVCKRKKTSSTLKTGLLVCARNVTAGNEAGRMGRAGRGRARQGTEEGRVYQYQFFCTNNGPEHGMERERGGEHPSRPVQMRVFSLIRRGRWPAPQWSGPAGSPT